MSKISTVSRTVTRVANENTVRYVILLSVFLLAMGSLQGCGNKGDLYRESDTAAGGLQEAAEKIRNSQSNSGDAEEEDEEDGKKPNKKNGTSAGQEAGENAATGN